MAGNLHFCLYSSSNDYGSLTKRNSEIGDGGKSDSNQHANQISEVGRLLFWIMNSGVFMDKKLQLELERG